MCLDNWIISRLVVVVIKDIYTRLPVVIILDSRILGVKGSSDMLKNFKD